MTILAILYLLVFVHEPLKKDEFVSGFDDPKIKWISGSKQPIEFVAAFEEVRKGETTKKKNKRDCSKQIVEFLKKISVLVPQLSVEIFEPVNAVNYQKSANIKLNPKHNLKKITLYSSLGDFCLKNKPLNYGFEGKIALFVTVTDLLIFGGNPIKED